MNESVVQNSIENILEIASKLSGAKLLAIYLAEERKPVLKRSTGAGSFMLLPEHLPAQELISLNKPQCWLPGKHPHSSLQRAARAANLPYLVSAPLGQANAAIGLVAFCGEDAPDEERLLPIARLVAEALTLTIQQRSLRDQAQSSQQALQARLQLADAMEEHASEAIILLSPELIIQRINPSAETILGYANREVAGQPAEYVLIGSETLNQALSAAQQGSPTFSYGRALPVGNVRLYRRSGDDFLAQVRVFPLREAENVRQILVFIQDLSEQEQIRTQAQQLEQRALLGEVTAVFAHEVRNPINNISTGLQLLALNLPEKDPSQSTVSGMLQDCDRLAELIKSVLSFSRPTEYALEPVDLAAVMRRLLERLHPRITRLNVQHNLHIQPDCPLILGNLRALEQIFNNLISNALQAMEESGGQLVIKIQHNPPGENRKYVEVSVADTGHGIPEALQERIFQPFFTTESGGTGLGLAVTKRIVTAHKGNIRLESFPGGTVFYVQFPAHNPNAEVT